MFNKKVVFVIGAGASVEVGLPSSEILKTQISKLVNFKFERYSKISGDDTIYEAIKIYAQQNDSTGNTTPFVHAGRKIHDAIHQVASIDSFIDNHFGDIEIELCGKLGICRAILRGERKRPLYFDSRNRDARIGYAKLEPTWYGQFLKLLLSNVRHDNIENIFQNVSFIIFNYDRCLEHYLFHSLKNIFKIQEEEAAKIVNNIEIHHPYGTVGSLPWQEKSDSFPFGGEVYPDQLLKLSTQIKTYSEQIDDEKITNPMRKAIQDAEAVIFLGFAFHDQNMKLIAPNKEKGYKTVLATALDVSQRDRNIIAAKMGKLTHFEGPKENIHIESLTCQKLFDNFWYEMNSW